MIAESRALLWPPCHKPYGIVEAAWIVCYLKHRKLSNTLRHAVVPYAFQPDGRPYAEYRRVLRVASQLGVRYQQKFGRFADERRCVLREPVTDLNRAREIRLGVEVDNAIVRRQEWCGRHRTAGIPPLDVDDIAGFKTAAIVRRG